MVIVEVKFTIEKNLCFFSKKLPLLISSKSRKQPASTNFSRKSYVRYKYWCLDQQSWQNCSHPFQKKIFKKIHKEYLISQRNVLYFEDFKTFEVFNSPNWCRIGKITENSFAAIVILLLSSVGHLKNFEVFK